MRFETSSGGSWIRGHCTTKSPCWSHEWILDPTEQRAARLDVIPLLDYGDPRFAGREAVAFACEAIRCHRPLPLELTDGESQRGLLQAIREEVTPALLGHGDPVRRRVEDA